MLLLKSTNNIAVTHKLNSSQHKVRTAITCSNRSCSKSDSYTWYFFHTCNCLLLLFGKNAMDQINLHKAHTTVNSLQLTILPNPIT